MPNVDACHHDINLMATLTQVLFTQLRPSTVSSTDRQGTHGYPCQQQSLGDLDRVARPFTFFWPLFFFSLLSLSFPLSHTLTLTLTTPPHPTKNPWPSTVSNTLCSLLLVLFLPLSSLSHTRALFHLLQTTAIHPLKRPIEVIQVRKGREEAWPHGPEFHLLGV
jgi:hypothetical protein